MPLHPGHYTERPLSHQQEGSDERSSVGATVNLDALHDLPERCITEVAEHGHTVVRGLASHDEVAAFRPAIEAAVARHAERMAPLDERDTYGKAFLQVPNLWQRDAVVERFVRAPRFAQVAAALLGVDGVRLYHDQALCKEPGGGYTPWHQDQVYWPFDHRPHHHHVDAARRRPRRGRDR